MLKVYKYQLPPEPGLYEIQMPLTAEILVVREQGSAISIWARVLTDEDSKMAWKFLVVETGAEAPPGSWLGTACFASGAYVLHIFDGS